MPLIDKLNKAKSFANNIRYIDDKLDTNIEIDRRIYNEIINNLSHQNLEITPEITPSLSDSLNKVCERLKIPLQSISAFIYPSEKIQASSLTTGFDRTILRFSSGLINLLDANEIEFVIGHELGHFLLNHGSHNHLDKDADLKAFMQRRYEEISADRIGLISCQSINTAIKSMFKLISGLNEKHLRFDITKFIGQIEKPTFNYSIQNLYSTHPSNLFRCRALLWFSLTDLITRGTNYYKVEEIKKIDKRVKKEFKDFIDGPILAKIEEAKNNYKLWVSAENIIKDGVFNKNEQTIFKSIFDEKIMVQLIGFLKVLNPSEINNVISQRIEEAKNELQYLIPDTFDEEASSIIQVINSRFNSQL